MAKDDVTIPKKEYEELKATVKKIKQQMDQGVDMDAGFKPLGGSTEIFKEANELYKANREAIKNTGQLLVDLAGPDGFVKKFAMLVEGDNVFDSIRPGIKALNELGASMRTFSMTQKDTQGELVKTAAVFNRLGVETAPL